MVEELLAKLNEIEDNTSIRVVIIRSTGKHASFGADLSELVTKSGNDYANISRVEAEQHITDGRAVAKKLFQLRVPTIGIVHGFCLGGGAEFYTLCDVLYGASGNKDEGGLMYGFPEPTIGVMAGWMGPEILTKRIGTGFARDLLFTGRIINADEALKIGAVQALYPKDELMPRAMEWANKVAANAPLAVEATRYSINRALFPHFDNMLESTGNETIEHLVTSDFIKGATKILTKSKDQPKYERR